MGFIIPPRKLCLWEGILFSHCPSIRLSVTFCFFYNLKSQGWNLIKPCKHIHIYRANTYNKKNNTPRKLCLWEGILFSYCPSIRPSVTFCFLNNLKSQGWNLIKPCIHIHIYRANAYNKKIRARGHFYESYFPL